MVNYITRKTIKDDQVKLIHATWFDEEIGIWRHSIKKLLIQVCFWRRRWSGAIGWLESTSMPKVRKVPSKNRSSKNIWPADRQINIARGTEWMGTKCKISQNTWSKNTTANKDVGRFDSKLWRESVQYREESFSERNVIKLPPWIQSAHAKELGKGKRQRGKGFAAHILLFTSNLRHPYI